jgi:uroporphyrinogen decarboxylase
MHMQTPREVVDALLRGKKAERMALMDSPWADTIVAWVEQGYPTRLRYRAAGETRWRPDDGRWEDVEQEGEYTEPVPAWEHFGFDMVGTGGWFDYQPLIGHSELVEESDEWDIKRNGSGAALKYWKHKSGTPEHIDFRMTSRDVWERDYRPYLLEWDPARAKNLQGQRDLSAEVRAAGRWSHFGHQFIWENMRQSMGDFSLYTSLLDDPAWVHDYNRVYTDLYKTAFTYLFEQVGVPDGIWLYEDLGYKNGLFASPKVLNEVIFPYFKEMVDFFHGYQMPVVLHTCGSVAQALPLIVEAGFDAINPMERKAKDNDPFKFAEKYGDRLAFVGGFDARIFETNDRDLIRKEMVAYMQGMKDRGARLVFASDHSISPIVTYDTFRYALEVFQENMWYSH